MNLKGSSVITVILIILLSIVAVSVFLSVTLRTIRNATVEERAKCIGLDFKVTQCILFPAGYTLPNTNYVVPNNGIYAVVERGYGGGDISDLRFSLKDSTNQEHIEIPVNLTGPGFRIYSDFRGIAEYSTVEAVITPINYLPTEITVAPVVGKKTVCEPVYPKGSCTLITAFIP
jgi:hypothetical protein